MSAAARLRREGLGHLAAGRFADAVRSLTAALPAYRADGAFRADLGLALRESGRLAEALPHLEAAAAALPGQAEVWGHLGVSLRRAGRLDEAIAALEKAEALDPAAPMHPLDRGDACVLAGRPAAAEAAYRRALSLADHPGAAYALGNLLVREGRPLEAARLLVGALSTHAGVEALWQALLGAMAGLEALPDDLAPYLLALLRRPKLDHQRLEGLVLASLPPGESPLLLAFLRVAAVRSPALEERLVALRDALLLRLAAGEAVAMPVLEAVAIAAWVAEWSMPAPARLPAELPEPLASVVALACGPGPIGDPAGLARVAPALHRLAVVGPQAEREAAAAIPCLGLADDAVSAAVAALYEGSPYPRLVSLPRPLPTTLMAHLRELFPSHQRPLPPEPGLQILVAGCGAGTQPLGVALRHPHAQVLGIDLSRASLGRAARLGAGCANLSFAQADILALAGWERRFGLIECAGVLHHLDDPLAGWRVLVGLLAPRGLMKIALYSARARAEIDAGRALHAALGLATDDAGLRAFRQAVLALPASHPAAPLRASPDFFSLTGLRDLVFHPCERRFSPAGVQAALDALGLDFIGLQHPDPRVPARFVAGGYGEPSDLAAWERFEIDHPRAFAGMIQLWCQPPVR